MVDFAARNAVVERYARLPADSARRHCRPDLADDAGQDGALELIAGAERWLSDPSLAARYAEAVYLRLRVVRAVRRSAARRACGPPTLGDAAESVGSADRGYAAVEARELAALAVSAVAGPDHRDAVSRRFGLDGGGVRSAGRVAAETGRGETSVRRSLRRAMAAMRDAVGA